MDKPAGYGQTKLVIKQNKIPLVMQSSESELRAICLLPCGFYGTYTKKETKQKDILINIDDI